MSKSKKILLTTLPNDKCIRDWKAPTYFKVNEGGANYAPSDYIPLGILSLASNLDNTKHNVIILDASGKSLTIDETVERIEQERPDILGISSNTMRAYALREILARTTTPYKAVGGPHVNNYSELTLKQGADVVFVGSVADFAFRDAIDTMPKGVIKCTTKYDEVSFPDRTLIDYESYFPQKGVFFQAKNRLHLISSIGCPNKCVFCTAHEEEMQRKSPITLVDEMQHLYSIGARSIHFLDENFNVSENYLNRVLDEKEKRGLNFELSGRGQVKMSNDLAKRLSEHGFKRIHVGIEALDDDILRFYNKASSVKQIYKFCKIMNENNIDILAHFVIGTPIETDQYLQDLPEKIKKLGIKHPRFQILSPTPDTKYYYSLLKDGLYGKDYWGEYIKNPTPDFKLPYPYDEKKLENLKNYIHEVEKNYRRD